MKIKRTLFFLCALVFSLSGCVVVNNVSRVNPNDAPAYSDRAIVVLGLGWDANHSATASRVSLYKYAPGKNHKFENDCFFSTYDLIQPWSAPKSEVQYFVFSVTPGYYAYRAKNFIGRYTSPNEKEEGKIVFKVDGGKVSYLGDFIQTDSESVRDCLNCEPHYTVEYRQNLEAAKIAVRNFKSIKTDLIFAEHVEIEGQAIPPPMCSL